MASVWNAGMISVGVFDNPSRRDEREGKRYGLRRKCQRRLVSLLTAEFTGLRGATSSECEPQGEKR